MAIDYFLKLHYQAQQDHLAKIRNLLIERCKLSSNSGSIILTGEGAGVSIFESEDGLVCIAFRIDKFEKYQRGLDQMSEIISLLFQAVNCDAELSFDFEEIELERKQSCILFSSNPYLWTEYRKSLLNKN